MRKKQGSGIGPASSQPPPVNPLLEAHARLREAERLRQAKALDKAQAICAELVKAHPDYVGALHTLGLIHADRCDYETARLIMSRAAMLSPRDWKILTALAGIYLKLGASEMAMRTLEQAQALKPGDASIVATLAEIYREEREYEPARAAYEQAGALNPSLKAMRTGLGWSLTHLGRFEEAAQVFTSLAREDPQDLAALWALGQMPASLVEIDVLKCLDELRAPKGSGEEFEITLGFARAAALDRAGRHQEAWSELAAANARVFARLAEAARKEEETRMRHLELLRRLGARRDAPSGKPGLRQSLFILGPSRSGKTTMERLTALLGGVRRGYENPIVENAIRHTFQSAGLITRLQLVELPPQLDEIFRQTYLAELAERAQDAQVFTNTHPARIVDAWRLAIAVPDARFVFIKRNANDLALRIYMKRYKSGHYPYAYDLPAIFRFIAWYHEMIDRTAAQFPELACIISYEDMIANPRQALATVAELCGLAIPDIALPELGDDRGAALPYREAMEKALKPG